ncbi:MAG: sensor histidine kinase, partial [Pseudomonadota bacterium]
DLPAQLLSEEDIFAAEAKPIGSAINAGLFGAGFSLRLARAEARSAGGGLARENERLTLSLPLLGEANALQGEV